MSNANSYYYQKVESCLCKYVHILAHFKYSNEFQLKRVFMRIDVRFSQTIAPSKIATILDNGSSAFGVQHLFLDVM